jgi:hypothetical protein
MSLLHQIRRLRLEKINWEEMEAVMISADPKPAELNKFKWKWEQQGQYSKLLGFYFGEEGIDEGMVFQQIKSNSAEQLGKARLTPFTPTERKVVVTQLLEGSLWYVLTLWKGKEQELQELDRIMANFIWAGQKEYSAPKVDLQTLYKPKKEGGIGLISIRALVKCMLVRFLLWAMAEGSHSLQLILRHRIRELSYKKWGVKDFSWMFNACCTLKQQGSSLWNNMVQVWSSISNLTVLNELR